MVIKYHSRNMHRRLRHCLVILPWIILSLTKRQLNLVGVIAAASITMFVTGIYVKSSYSTAPLTFSNSFIPRHDCKSWRTTPQHKTTLITKTPCTRKYFLLILVSSAPANIERRDLIRQTWGTDNSITPQWKTYFLLGQTTNQTHSDSVQLEGHQHGDIIRADYYEHYWKQSLKIQMAFEWAARYCKFSYLLKTDDDVLINTDDLIKFLQRKSTPSRGLFMGKLHHNPIVRRAGKWNVSYEEYNHTHYPDFCSGAGFVMSYDVIECAVPLFDVIKPYRMDDVYVGMLANESGVIAVDHTGFYMPIDDYDDCIFVPNTLAQHRATGQCLLKLFRMHSKDFLYGTKLGSFF